jgi:hypothetical protein
MSSNIRKESRHVVTLHHSRFSNARFEDISIPGRREKIGTRLGAADHLVCFERQLQGRFGLAENTENVDPE